VNEATSDSRHKEFVVDLELNGMLEMLSLLGQHVVEAFGLWNCPWETIEDETGMFN